MKFSTKTFMALIALLLSATTWAGQGKDLFTAQKVTDHVYAYIGPTTDRTPENLGLNNNIGLSTPKMAGYSWTPVRGMRQQKNSKKSLTPSKTADCGGHQCW